MYKNWTILTSTDQVLNNKDWLGKEDGSKYWLIATTRRGRQCEIKQVTEAVGTASLWAMPEALFIIYVGNLFTGTPAVYKLGCHFKKNGGSNVMPSWKNKPFFFA